MVKEAPVEEKKEAASSKVSIPKKKAISKAEKPATTPVPEKKKSVVTIEGKKIPAEKTKATAKNATKPVFKPAIAPAEKALTVKSTNVKEDKKAGTKLSKEEKAVLKAQEALAEK